MISAGNNLTAILQSGSARLPVCSLRSLAANFGFQTQWHSQEHRDSPPNNRRRIAGHARSVRAWFQRLRKANGGYPRIGAETARPRKPNGDEPSPPLWRSRPRGASHVGTVIQSFTIKEFCGVSHPNQIIDFDFSGSVDWTKAYRIGPAGTEVPYQVLQGGKIAVQTDLPANGGKDLEIDVGSRANAVRGRCQSQPNTDLIGANGNGMSAGRIMFSLLEMVGYRNFLTVSTLNEIEAAVESLPALQQQALLGFLTARLGHVEQLGPQQGSRSSSLPQHSVLDIPTVRLGRVLRPLSPDDDLFSEMLEGRG